MTTTLSAFARAMDKAAALEEKLPAAIVVPLGTQAVKILVDASAASGGVKARENAFKLRLPKVSNGFAFQAIVGSGFAQLDEYGSYHKPGGYPIEPGWKYGQSLGGSGGVLSDFHDKGGSKGFFAAYVFHPPQKAHPFVERAQAEISILVEKTANKEQAKLLLAVFV